MVRQAEQKRKRAINEHNREVRRVNAHNKRVVDNYNRDVRAHNQRVRANRRRLQSEIAKLNSQRTTTRYVTYRTSVQTLQRSFTRIEEASEQETWTASDDLFEMAEGETANSVAVLNALLDDPTARAGDDEARLRDTVITHELNDISADLDARWRGALFALSPVNPDAARQFCTSAREIFVNLLDLKAPNDAVRAAKPNMKLINGQVPRREKIYYCLAQSGQQDETLVDFVEDDINNVMNLFGEFNPATHGEAGKYDFVQLSAIKMRVEGAIQFLHRIVTY
jgi:hypothetical protein